MKDGLPIGLGYLSVSFAFGIFAVGQGLSVLQTLLISMTNVTSAGQLAGVPIIVAMLPIIEMVISQLVINMRYAMMSIALSQKFDDSIKLRHRFLIAFVNTDEVFAVASSKKFLLGKNYLFGLILLPYLGWASGTLIGAIAGNILDKTVISALGIAIYAMFIAIIIPPAKENRAITLVILVAVALSCLFRYLPILNSVSQGIAIIICAILSSALFAFLRPIQVKEENNND